MLTIRTRIILTSIAVFAVALAGVSIVVYRSYHAGAMATLDARMESFAERVTAEVEEQHDEGIFLTVADLQAVHLDGLSRTAVRLTDSTGAALYTDSLCAAMPTQPWRAVLEQTRIRETVTLGEAEFRSLWMPVEVGDRLQYLLQVVTPLDETNGDLARLRGLFLLTIPVALLLSAVAAYLIVGRAFRPIREMIAMAKDTNERNLGRGVPVPDGKDEVHDLAETLNGMMERLAAAFEGQKRFIADASHEIRTPLAIVQSELDFLARQVSDPQGLAALRSSQDELDRLKHLAENLLFLETLDASDDVLNIRAMRLDELLAECVRRMRPLAEQRGITLRLQIGSVVERSGDADRMERAVVNLIDNAVKYSPPGSRVEVDLGEYPDGIHIAVRDNGIGIPPEELDGVFERFRRVAKNNESGSGLGLAIVRRVVELHGGTIRLESAAGKGTTFIIVLPPER